jgi:hypothetical protein
MTASKNKAVVIVCFTIGNKLPKTVNYLAFLDYINRVPIGFIPD